MSAHAQTTSLFLRMSTPLHTPHPSPSVAVLPTTKLLIGSPELHSPRDPLSFQCLSPFFFLGPPPLRFQLLPNPFNVSLLFRCIRPCSCLGSPPAPKSCHFGSCLQHFNDRIQFRASVHQTVFLVGLLAGGLGVELVRLGTLLAQPDALLLLYRRRGGGGGSTWGGVREYVCMGIGSGVYFLVPCLCAAACPLPI